MKKLITLIYIFCILLSNNVFAQDCEVPVGIALPVQPELVPGAARTYLINKMRQMVTTTGITADVTGSQFYLSAKIDILEKDLLPGPPVQHSYRLQIIFLMVDDYNEKIVASSAVEVKAVGNNETKAYMDGIRRINAKNQELQSFLEDGKKKIIQYYDGNYQKILANAQVQCDKKQYGMALSLALSIPPCCEGYEQALQVAVQSFQQYVDQQCQILLAKAQSVWIARQNTDGAIEAGKYLSQIYPDAACYKEAVSLSNDIKKEVQNDKVFELKRYNDAVSIEKQRVEAMKAVGVAFGSGPKEKKETTNIMWIK